MKKISASENKSEEIVLAIYEDWQGLYCCGKLVEQDHKIKIKDIFECINSLNTIIYAEIKNVDSKWFSENGCEFPDYLDDVKFKD